MTKLKSKKLPASLDPGALAGGEPKTPHVYVVYQHDGEEAFKLFSGWRDLRTLEQLEQVNTALQQLHPGQRILIMNWKGLEE